MPVILRLVKTAGGDIGRCFVAGELRGAHFGLLPERRDQAEDLAAMLDAFADRVDIGIAGAHVVTDDDAAVDIEPGGARQVDIGADADRQHDEIGRRCRGRRRAARLRPARSPRISSVWPSVKNAMPRASRSRCNSSPAAASSWRSISVGIRCTTATDMPRRFRPHAASRPSKPAADHHGALDGVRDAAIICVDIGDVAKGAARRADASPGIGGASGFEPVREQQLVVGDRFGRSRPSRVFAAAVDRRRPASPVSKVDAVLGIPAARVDDDVVDRLLAGQHRRQHDAVVVGVRLGAEDGDLVARRGARFSNSSTVRIAAMPLPTTTSRSLAKARPSIVSSPDRRRRSSPPTARRRPRPMPR